MDHIDSRRTDVQWAALRRDQFHPDNFQLKKNTAVQILKIELYFLTLTFLVTRQAIISSIYECPR